MDGVQKETIDVQHYRPGFSCSRRFRFRWRWLVALSLVLMNLLSGGNTIAQTRPPGGTVTYPAGWNLVSGPDFTDFTGAQAPMYTFQPGDRTYEKVNGTQDTRGGWGYWAYFPSGADVSLPAGSTEPYSVAVFGGQYTMVGNPSGLVPATVSGVDAIYTYSSDSGYQPASILAPGQGAWVLASQNTMIAVTPQSSATSP